MTNFNDLLHAELFQKGSKTNLTNRVSSLLEAFPHNKNILLEVENYYFNNIKDSKDYAKNIKDTFNDILKKEWLYIWTKQDIDKNELPIIKRYFNNFNAVSQQKIYDKINVVSPDNDFVLKQMREKGSLTIALQNFKKGNDENLKEFLSNAQKLTEKDIERISIAIKMSDINLEIYNSLIEKVINSHECINIPHQNIEKVFFLEPNSVEKFLKLYIKYEMFAYLRSETDKSLRKDINVMGKIVEKVNDQETFEKYVNENSDSYPMYYFEQLSTSTRVLFWNDVKKLFHKLNSQSPDKIMNALSNMNHLLAYQKPAYIEFFKKKFKRDIDSANIEHLFNLLEDKKKSKKKTFREINFSNQTIDIDDFAMQYENVFKTYQMKKLTEGLEDSKPLQAKHKI